jgi:hypothetical protein
MIYFYLALVYIVSMSMSYKSFGADIVASLLGTFEIVSKSCSPSDSYCSALSEVSVKRYDYGTKAAYILTEVSKGIESRVTLAESEIEDPYGHRIRIIVEGTPNLLRWLKYEEWGFDEGVTLESRTFQRFGDSLLYSNYFELLANADGHKVSFERHYKMKAK